MWGVKMLLFVSESRYDLRVSVTQGSQSKSNLKCEKKAGQTVFFRLSLRTFIALWSSLRLWFTAASSSLCALNFCRRVVNTWSKVSSNLFSLKSESEINLYRRGFLALLSLRVIIARFFMVLLCADCFGVFSQINRTAPSSGRGSPSTWLSGRCLSVSNFMIRKTCFRIAC